MDKVHFKATAKWCLQLHHTKTFLKATFPDLCAITIGEQQHLKMKTRNSYFNSQCHSARTNTTSNKSVPHIWPTSAADVQKYHNTVHNGCGQSCQCGFNRTALRQPNNGTFYGRLLEPTKFESPRRYIHRASTSSQHLLFQKTHMKSGHTVFKCTEAETSAV